MANGHDELAHDERFNFSPEELMRLENRWKSDVDIKLDKLDRRTVTIERLVWIAVGATTIIGGLAVVGLRQLEKYSDGLTAVVVQQAAAISERKAHIEALKADIQRLREGRR